MALLHRLHDDQQVSLSAAASDAYYKTLYNNHTWYTSAAFVVVLKVSLRCPCLVMHVHARVTTLQCRRCCRVGADVPRCSRQLRSGIYLPWAHMLPKMEEAAMGLPDLDGLVKGLPARA